MNISLDNLDTIYRIVVIATVPLFVLLLILGLCLYGRTRKKQNIALSSIAESIKKIAENKKNEISRYNEPANINIENNFNGSKVEEKKVNGGSELPPDRLMKNGKVANGGTVDVLGENSEETDKNTEPIGEIISEEAEVDNKVMSEEKNTFLSSGFDNKNKSNLSLGKVGNDGLNSADSHYNLGRSGKRYSEKEIAALIND